MEETKVTRGKVLGGLAWTFGTRIGKQLVSFIISLILARLLMPEDYGLISIITIFVSVLNVFISSGFGSALIQKKNADETDFSSVFFFQIAFSVVLYFLLFLSAPLIALFYSNDQLIPIIRVLGLTLIVNGVNNVQSAFVSKTMQFKRFFLSSITATVLSGVLGIIMAYCGFGVWAIVAQQLSTALFSTIVLWFTVKWRPTFSFSFARLKGLFSYGWKLLTSSLIDTLYNNIYGLLIGKIFDPTALGLYNRGNQFPTLIVENLNSPIQQVLLPTIASQQDNQIRVKDMVRRSIKTSTFIVFPLLIGMAAIATPMVKILLTDKWLDCVPFLQLSCVAMAFWPIHTTNLQAINALGRSDIYLKLEIIKKIIGISVLILSIPFGLYFMMVGRVITSLISSFINAFPNKKLLNYGYLEQIKDILPAVFISLVMGAAVLCVELLNLNVYLTLVIQIVGGGIIYIVLSKLFKLEAFEYLLDMVKSKLRK